MLACIAHQRFWENPCFHVQKVVGKIQLHVILELGLPFPCWLLAQGQGSKGSFSISGECLHSLASRSLSLFAEVNNGTNTSHASITFDYFFCLILPLPARESCVMLIARSVANIKCQPATPSLIHFLSTYPGEFLKKYQKTPGSR